MNNRTSRLDEYEKEIKKEEESWKVTEESLHANESSETVLENVQSILLKLTQTDKDIVAQIDIIFKSLNGISERKVLIQSAINQLDRITQIKRQKFFSIDSNPIWKIQQDSLGFSNFQLEIKANGTIEFEIPEDENEKFAQFYELVNMMTIDGNIFDEEMNLCVLIGKKFEYNNVLDVIEIMIQDIKIGLPMENTRNSVDWLLH